MKVSLLDVARLANVSKSTASRAINNEGRVDEETKKRVLDAVQRLQYQPNRMAQSLRSRQSNVIGVLFSNLFAGHFYSEIFRGIEEHAFENNYSLILGCSDGSEEKERKLIGAFMAQQVAGIILTPTNGFMQKNLAFLQRSNIPAVCIDREIAQSTLDYVGTDNFCGGGLAASHLIHAGHKSIAICLGREKDAVSIQNRLDGVKTALGTHGVAYMLLEHVPDTDSKAYGYHAVMASESKMQERGVSAILAMSDMLAVGCMKACENMGYTIGQGFSVIGYNNDDICDYLHVPLTTVEQPKYEIGRRAFYLLKQRMQEEPGALKQRIILQPKLVIRNSCGEKNKGVL